MARVMSACFSPVIASRRNSMEGSRRIGILKGSSKHHCRKSTVRCQISGSETVPGARRSSSSSSTEDYNTAMKRMMRNPYEYHHDLEVRRNQREKARMTSIWLSPVIASRWRSMEGRHRIGILEGLSKHYCRRIAVRCEVSGSGMVPQARSIMEDYNTAMKRMTRNPYAYHHDLGMNYTIISDSLIVGSQPQKPEDIDHLKKEENVAYILCLQQDSDVEYWEIELHAIIKRCKELGVRHMRRPVRSGICSGFWTCVDMASGRYLWRMLVSPSSSSSPPPAMAPQDQKKQ